MSNQSDIPTEVFERAAEKALAHHQEKCPFKNDAEAFERKFEAEYNKRAIKIIGGFSVVVLGLAGSLLGIWISLTSDIAILKERQSGYQQVLSELKEIRTEITNLKINIAQNNKGTP